MRTNIEQTNRMGYGLFWVGAIWEIHGHPKILHPKNLNIQGANSFRHRGESNDVAAPALMQQDAHPFPATIVPS